MTVISILKDIVDAARPRRSPLDAFDEVLRDKERRYEELRRNVLRILFLKSKLEAELVERRAEVARVYHAARTAARRGDDELCLSLLAERRRLESGLKKAEEGVQDARRSADEARRALDGFKDEMRDLERERSERALTLDAVALDETLRRARRGERAEREETKLDMARMHIDAVAAERDVERRLLDEPDIDFDLETDTDLRIELARLKQQTRKLRQAACRDGAA